MTKHSPKLIALALTAALTAALATGAGFVGANLAVDKGARPEFEKLGHKVTVDNDTVGALTKHVRAVDLSLRLVD